AAAKTSIPTQSKRLWGLPRTAFRERALLERSSDPFIGRLMRLEGSSRCCCCRYKEDRMGHCFNRIHCCIEKDHVSVAGKRKNNGETNLFYKVKWGEKSAAPVGECN